MPELYVPGGDEVLFQRVETRLPVKTRVGELAEGLVGLTADLLAVAQDHGRGLAVEIYVHSSDRATHTP
mgnify:CR=1 FL=1